jgi:hypothetical protein
LLIVDPDTGTIWYQLALTSLPYQLYANYPNTNHGNFFMTYIPVGTKYRISYLSQILPAYGIGDSLMIEMN